jgi:co-chaperonin GroES (HSP10)
MQTIRVLGERVLAVKEVREAKEVSKTGLYIPDDKEDKIAKVVFVSSDITDIKEGDVIYYSSDSGTIEDYLVIEYKNILAIQ